MKTEFVRSLVAACAVASLLSGCTSVEGLRPDIAAKPLPSRLEEIAYINVLRSALAVTPENGKEASPLCFDGRDLRAFKGKLGQGYRETRDPENFTSGERGGDNRAPTTAPGCLMFRSINVEKADEKQKMKEYLGAGFGLTDLYCKRFFVVASEAQQNRQFARNVNNGIDTLVGSVLTLANASKTAIGIANGGFGFIDGTLEGYDLAYLVGPDMADVERLVKAEQAVFRQKVFDKDKPEFFPETYAAARAVIEAYAGTCSFTGMRQLVAKSVADKTEALGEKANAANKDGKVTTDGTTGNDKPPPTKTPPPPPSPQPAPTEEPKRMIESTMIPVF